MASPARKLLLRFALLSRSPLPQSLRICSSAIRNQLLWRRVALPEIPRVAGGARSVSFVSDGCLPKPFSTDAGSAVTNYQNSIPEQEFHRLADDTIHSLQEKFEEYGDALQIDGFDIDYGNQVLTLKLGSSGTYVINKQTPNRQIWLSSPVSGPARFDWDATGSSWVYRRTNANLLRLLEEELEQLCGQPIDLL